MYVCVMRKQANHNMCEIFSNSIQKYYYYWCYSGGGSYCFSFDYVRALYIMHGKKEDPCLMVRVSYDTMVSCERV